MKFEKSAFECARENIKQIVFYMRNELQLPTDMIKLQLDAIIQSLIIQERIKNESHST